MDTQRRFLVWAAMVAVLTGLIYISSTLAWYWALLIAVLIVAVIVGGATGFMYWKQKKLVDSAAKFNIDLKNGKIHPADLRRMYFSGGQARSDALLIASQAMRCSVQEAEKQLGAKITKQAAQQEMAKQQGKNKGKQRRGRPR
ncbi:hypothetical protein [Kingella negevensis]|uniref:Uncharacterized protein n=1 Tax=Kingella negevensis TaxID=1522312 RepID=A0A238HHL3_9NEIS|nr:hypothetical protein [Kingella negevensis]MDK4680587.1 magnesium transporter [Kingella negevensis]MDK4681690.1 magnesium transporter [Kingella negevensis]MDK4685189.1 magnesium transporter [Kingella negevensis]MDK4688719.1 magnesium transporter [Kingella negevensis]MDK4689888.1 magnesium transporter [Kingella negevensis]